MTGPGLRRLNYGVLPTRQALNLVCRFEGLPAGVTSVDELHREMRSLLARGELAALRVLLARVGFEWEREARA